MKIFDLHPKAATYARKKTVAGGLLTVSTLLIGVILLYFLAKTDLGERTEDVRIDAISHDDSLPVYIDISFIGVTSCNNIYQVEVIDALHRVVKDPNAKISTNHWRNECRVSGSIHIPAGKGTFRVYPAVVALENIKANHRINSLSVGSQLSGVPHEARAFKTEDMKQDRAGAWSYYLSLVPTTSNGVNGYQIAATRTFVELAFVASARGSLYFIYEAAPVRMHLDSRISFSKILHFFARAIGIMSGLFAFVGLAREVFLTTSSNMLKKKKKKSDLVF